MEIKSYIFSVTEINSAIKEILEDAFPEVWIKGEISNLRNYSNHLFFTLKDEKSQIKAVLFRGFYNTLKFSPKEGMSVLVRGSLSLYQARGEFQATVNYMEPLGIGTLKLAFEELKKKLAGKGYFDEARKKPAPAFPRTIGVITSPKGAVIRDILNILRRRHFNLRIIIFPVKVQGEGAKEEIAGAIKSANEKIRDTIDVLILARGGGSLEDLWAFNEEIVADAIFHSSIPVVSAIGHETDFTIADFTADLRTPTPSAAAELVVQKKADIENRIYQLLIRLKNAALKHLGAAERKTAAEKRALKSPQSVLRQKTLYISDLDNRLNRSVTNLLNAHGQRLNNAEHRFYVVSPAARLKLIRERLNGLCGGMSNLLKMKLMRKREGFSMLAGKIETLSPLKILSRGYSIAFNIKENKVLKDAASVAAGDPLKIKLHKGAVLCEVTGKSD